MRLVFFGTPDAAVPSFEALADGHEIVLAVTQPERGRGAGQRRPVAGAAAARGIPVRTPNRARDVGGEIAALGPDAAAVVAFGQILPPAVLGLFPLGMVNLHFSLLPRWRGAAPVERAILAGYEVTGISTMVLDAGMDTGPVLQRLAVPIEPGERAGELTQRLAGLGAPLLVRSLEGLADGTLQPEPQDDQETTLAPKVTAADALLDWGQRAADVERRVRAMHPRPGAVTSFRGRRLKVARASEGTALDPSVLPGELATGPLRAAASDAWVVLDEVQLEGKAAVDGDAFARGARVQAGEALGHA
jgi:methionyl-tRNA formyltransferase